jgi:hypothetical protein
MSKETTNNLKENYNFFHLKLRKQILRIGLHELVRVKSEVNFAANRITLDDNLKTFWNKILSSIYILCTVWCISNSQTQISLFTVL